MVPWHYKELTFVISHFICFIIFQAFADLVIKVLDENDSPPQFKESSYEAAIAENSIAGKTVVPVSRKLCSSDGAVN